ncbi:hypothetical protein H6F51_14250 [Cyanobacteria bacterium FACHB-DQ100]|nr:hypothetical protein [Cyanobacteria bacterium FACHB-DQ100]
MNINLHIDRLILEDVDLSPSERLRLQGAIEAELSRLLTIKGSSSRWGSNNWIPKLSIHLDQTTTTNSVQLAHEIAQSIYAEMQSHS